MSSLDYFRSGFHIDFSNVCITWKQGTSAMALKFQNVIEQRKVNTHQRPQPPASAGLFARGQSVREEVAVCSESDPYLPSHRGHS